MTSTPTIQSTSLHFREGNSDNSGWRFAPIQKTARRVHTGMADGGKVYHAAIEPSGEGYIVTFAYGRRGNTLTTGTKTTYPVNIAEATKVFDKLISSKLAKGYQHSNAPSGEAKPYRQNGDEGRDSGIRCQLLNPIEPEEVNRLLTSTSHCLQEWSGATWTGAIRDVPEGCDRRRASKTRRSPTHGSQEERRDHRYQPPGFDNRHPGSHP